MARESKTFERAAGEEEMKIDLDYYMRRWREDREEEEARLCRIPKPKASISYTTSTRSDAFFPNGILISLQTPDQPHSAAPY